MEQRKAYRALNGRQVAGVAMGLARHLGVDVRVVRVVLVAATLLGSGAGLLAYLALWALLPMDPSEVATTEEQEPVADPGWVILIAVASTLTLLGLMALGFTRITTYALPLALAALGITLVWMRADEVQRARWRRDAAGAARGAAADAVTHGRWRVVAGILAVVVAVFAIGLSSVGVTTMLQGLATTLLLLVGLGLVAFPWLHDQWQRLADERASHIRAEERADMAARIHDSVLQTLTLVQRHSDDPQRVLQLARSEERALRDWLYGEEHGEASLAAALRRIVQQVEERHGVTVDLVAVGDIEVDPPLEALLAATQEAMVNAAKHSGAASIRVFAEVEPEAVCIFVRDRGVGFDPDQVADDRAGIRESVIARMQRVGGSAGIRSLPGEGTEVSLRLPREAM